MPYTPPSNRSPATSTHSSPEASRRPSLATGGSRPSLPRSASYLTRHRRTPSAPTTLQQNGGHKYHQPTPEGTSEDLKSMLTSSSVRKSPPPVTDGLGIPSGAILSPPESAAGSDDDDLPEVRGRQLDNLRELHDAISQIPQKRESSPTRTGGAPLKVVVDSPKQGEKLHTSFSTGTLDALAGAARRISHQRSATESDVMVPKSADSSLSASDADSEEEMMMRKPQMVRKKSGELVRPALRPPSRRRPSSMPGTPTFSKAVHFDSHLEHVRHFLQVDRPLAVSAGSSPADNYGSDNEFPFPGGDGRPESRMPPFEWEIIVTNFPLETPARKAQPVRLERVWLSTDQKSLVGSVAVANLAFQKHITCRFTFDYWKTTSEVAAEYSCEIRPHDSPVGHDRFNFTIKLSEMANLESKTLYFCIRYNVIGQELWDNNNGTNFQIDFRKKMLPQNGKRGFQGASARPLGSLPRSNRRGHASEPSRPKTAPTGMSEFGQSGKLNFDQSIEDYLGDDSSTSIRLKGVKSTSSLPSDNLSSRLTAPSGQAFANRYDFGASLSTAIQAAKQTAPKGDGLYMKGNTKGMPRAAPAPTTPPVGNGTTSGAKSSSTETTTAAKRPEAANQPNLAFPGASPTGPSSLASASYEELVNKYCFFGSKQPSPPLNDGTLKSGGRFDGASDDPSGNPHSSTESSLAGTPLHMAGLNRSQHSHGAQHHSLRAVNSYFHQVNASSFPQSSPPVSPLPQHPSDRSAAAFGQPRSSSDKAPTTGRQIPPATGMAGSFHPMTGTSPSDELQYRHRHQHMHDRFPFTETHAATAIRG